MRNPTYHPALDGLRAIAVIAVLLSHWHPLGSALFNWGLAGVYLFFTISGYVVTASLLRDIQGSASLTSICANFYVRRALRIWPIYFLLIIACHQFWPNWPSEATAWHLGFLSNYWFGHLSEYAFPVHFWSLSVEQQYYLLWPFVVFCLPARALVGFCLALLLLAPLSRYYFYVALENYQHAYYALSSNTDCVAIGALMAICERRSDSAHIKTLLFSQTVTYAGLITLVISITAQHLESSGIAIALGGTGCALLAPWLINRFPVSLAGRYILRLPWLQTLGKVSYGIYLYHLFIGLLVFRFYSDNERWRAFQIPVAFTLTCLFSILSWNYIERPILNLKNRFRPT